VSYLSPGTVLQERYEIVQEIGRGGHSVVYLARDRRVGQEVALKLLAPPPSAEPVARERLRREVLAVRELAHEHIVQVHDCFDEGPWSYIVMEYVAGPDLAQRVSARGPLDPEDAARMAEGIAQALSAAHRRGILHRDVKPQNILLAPDGRARLTDFGSARLEGQQSVTRTGGVVGTLDYLPPEVVAGERGDARADLYSLGMTLHHALAGRLPERPSPHLPPPPSADGYRPSRYRADIPGWLDDATACATAALPGDRFPSAARFAQAMSPDGRRAGVVTLPASRALGFCLLCGADEPLGLGLCAGCAALRERGEDTLILLHPPGHRAVREHSLLTLRQLAPGASPQALGEAAAGRRALARVPLAGSSRVLERLGELGLDGRAASGRWAPMPWMLYGVAVAVVAMGWLAGRVGSPHFLWLSPLFATLLMLEGQRKARTPLLAAPGGSTLLSPAARERLAGTVAALPAGTALSLLAELARNAQALLSRMQDGTLPGDSGDVDALVLQACEAARDLAELEENLTRLEAAGSHRTGPPARWGDAVTRAGQVRDALVQRMLDAITALGEARARAAEAASVGGDRLAELAAELRSEVTAYTDARREVEAAL
jgi:serine/threonine-protein kinase